MTTYNLKPMDNRKSFYGKAKVEERDDGSKVLYSYGTPVCGVTVSGRFFRAWGGYSATTMRHVNSFLEAEGMNGGGKAWWDKQPVEDATRRRASDMTPEESLRAMQAQAAGWMIWMAGSFCSRLFFLLPVSNTH